MDTRCPFKYGPVALDEAFTDRELELAELVADALNGQDVVIFAPRRYGKTSLVRRAAQRLLSEHVLVAAVDLWTTPSKERLAAHLAREVAEIRDLGGRLRELGQLFSGLRVAPVMNLDPSDGSVSFSFGVGHAAADIDQTLERLLGLFGETAAERRRAVVVILDEFQEITEIDAGLTRLMRAAFQDQPEVSHIYLGSKRHLMERIFSDANEPFWRSAKRVELGPIPSEHFASFIAAGFRSTGRGIEEAMISRVLALTGGHPYATQQLCYFLWAQTDAGAAVDAQRLEQALARLLISEDSHFGDIWDRCTANQRIVLTALAAEPGRPFSAAYAQRHGLRSASVTQRALSGLAAAEIVVRDGSYTRIAEPFLAEWIALRGL